MDARARELYERTFTWELLPALARLLPAGLIGLILGVVATLPVLVLADVAGMEGERIDALGNLVVMLVGLPLAGLLAGLPHLLSLLALRGTPGGDLWTAVQRGAREPTPFEDAVLRRTLDGLDRASGGRVAAILGETRLFVLEGTNLDACVVGTGLYVTRPLLEAQSRYLAPVLAHELGHIAAGDHWLQLALQRFVVTEGERLRAGSDRIAAGAVRVGTLTRSPWGCLFGLYFWLIFKLVGAGRGGLGLKLVGPSWAEYWREREFAADAFAQSLGQGRALIEYLRRHRFLDTAIPYFPFVSGHPYTTVRIDRLRWLEGERP